MSYHGYDDVIFINLELEPEIIQNFTSFTYIDIFVFNFKLSFYLPLIVLEKQCGSTCFRASMKATTLLTRGSKYFEDLFI